MKKGIIFLLVVGSASTYAEEAVCHKCEVIREENKKKVNPYEYYEDYLKAEQEKSKQGEIEVRGNPDKTNKAKEKSKY